MYHIGRALAGVVGRKKTYCALHQLAALNSHLRVQRRQLGAAYQGRLFRRGLIVVYYGQLSFDKLTRQSVGTSKSIVAVRFVEHTCSRRYSRIKML